MMTIKGFAQLCQCTAQTLRYYDQVGLLKPARVDKWSGYRYYEEKQAVDFVKIKHLQAADFTIAEIKALLTKTDQAVYDAFEQKIATQREKLAQIIQIQQTYLREKNSMEKIHHSMTNFLLAQCNKPELLAEFGIEPEDYEQIKDILRDWLNRQIAESSPNAETVQLQINDEVTQGAENIAARIDSLTRGNLNDTILLKDNVKTNQLDDPAAFETVWEHHGWAHVRDFINDIPALSGEKDYLFDLRVTDPELREDLSFAMFMLGSMLLRNGAFACMRGCNVESSSDGQNHFALLRRK